MAKCLLIGAGGGGGESWITSIPEMHRNIFRGKYLGNAVTAAQLAAIADGSFDDLYVGDYWIINDVTWRVADADYWYGTGDTAFNVHHLVIVPDDALYSAAMNDSDTTSGGYVGSKMRTTNLNQAKTMINTAFPDMVLTHRNYLINSVSGGKPSGGGWYDSTVELMSEVMLYGHKEFSPSATGESGIFNFTVDVIQLGLFRLAPNYISIGTNQWLRDAATSTNFVNNFAGRSGNGLASITCGVRPVFAIGVAA